MACARGYEPGPLLTAVGAPYFASRNAVLQERLEDPDALARARDDGRRLMRVAGVERPALEHETCQRAVAKQRDARNAQTGKLFQRRRVEPRLFVRDWREHYDHRHLPLLSCRSVARTL